MAARSSSRIENRYSSRKNCQERTIRRYGMEYGGVAIPSIILFVFIIVMLSILFFVLERSNEK